MRAKINLYNEDCLQAMKAMQDNEYDLAIVDPPYGIDAVNSLNTVTGGKKHTAKDWDDSAPDKEYFDELIRVSKNQIIWGANHFISKIPYDSSCWIVWDKKKGDFSLAAGELAWTSFKTAVRIFEWQWHGFLQQGEKEERIHPTQKPRQLYNWLLDKYAEKGDKILDTHLGSGSIALACHDRGFDLTACELDKEYFDNAVNRLKKYQSQLTMF